MALDDHPSFPQPKDPSVLVWRYLDTPKLLSLLLSKVLSLGRVDLFPDKFEGTHTRPTREALLRQLTATPPMGLSPERVKLMVDQIMSSPGMIRKWMFASCWCMSNHESEAMWRLYCGTGNGVALVLPYAQLKASLTDATTYIGKVTYIDYGRDFIDVGNGFNYVMHKRREFQHECEIGIVTMRPTDTTKPGSEGQVPTSFTLPWVPEEHLQSIVVSPYATTWYLQTMREIVARITPGLTERVVPSPMGGDPPA